jgi:vancomycin permeability regulator SanA
VLLAGAGAYLLAALILCAAGLRDDRERTADVAVVLGNQVFPDGTPSPRLAARLDQGLALYRRGTVHDLIVSGGVGREGWDEAAVMKRYLVARGIPADRVVADSLGVNTAATARNTAAIMRRHGWTRAVAVSQYHHVPRCRLAFRRAGISTVYGAHARYAEWRDVYSVTREVAGYAAYLAGLRE